MKIVLTGLFCLALFISALRVPAILVERKEKLSDFGFFKGTLADLVPSDDILFYDVNTPLFSNYAEKIRFIKFPDNGVAVYSDSISFDLPVGTILIKNFYYPNDFRNPAKGRRILETRLLVRQDNGWDAWPYLWNDEQTEAYYDPAGETKTVSYIDAKGKKRSTLYAVPNKNQCKGCHVTNAEMKPIGINARQLNRDIFFNNKRVSQLDHWREEKLLGGLLSSTDAPKLAVWNDASSGTVDDRARAYLDANCGHCHSASGPASTSGLFLDIHEKRPTHLGVNKTPVAAGRGSGDLQFDIVPGSPASSILLFRMKTTDPAVAMPEIGREQIHTEGVALIEEWIRTHKFD
jgi:uncharacterized repeat protein (TIGR03806 family)